jgi:general secretion pathway protein G
MNKQSGFTIVELLVVIVVIGVLAAITIVSYTGINQRATVASLQSDLSSAATQLKTFSVDNGIYPITMTCGVDSTTNKCLKPSGNSSYNIYQPNNLTNPSAFYLQIKNGTTCYAITESSAPTSALCDFMPGLPEAGYPTSLVGKYVYAFNTTGDPVWKTANTSCGSPQCSTTPGDPDFAGNMVLVSPQLNTGVDFTTSYPAQAACKAVGGRLPNMNELRAMYAGKVAGHYGTFPTNTVYWSATEDGSSYAKAVDFSSGGFTNFFNKNTANTHSRCVNG